MAKVALGIKILFIWLYNGFASLLLHSTATSMMNGEGLQSWQLFSLIAFFLVMVFLPEILFFTSQTFRSFVIEGAKDGDGITHMKDLKQTVILYVSLWSMRIFMGFSLGIILGMDISPWIYLIPLIGSFGTAGLAVLAQVIGKRS